MKSKKQAELPNILLNDRHNVNCEHRIFRGNSHKTDESERNCETDEKYSKARKYCRSSTSDDFTMGTNSFFVQFCLLHFIYLYLPQITLLRSVSPIKTFRTTKSISISSSCSLETMDRFEFKYTIFDIRDSFHICA